MHVVPASGVPQNASRLVPLDADAESMEPESSPSAATPLIRTRSVAEHDPTLLIAALDDLESKRLCIESLLAADLLWQCLA